ncbi:MAG: ABC transporter permease [Pirellula sp.]|nr:ABC transporter permease [Pirellula sp.]
MAFQILTPFLAANDFWMTKWLTPIWFLGVGVVFGFAILILFLGLFYGLSKVTALEKSRRDGFAHLVCLLVTLGLGSGLAMWTRFGFLSKAFIGDNGSFETEEWAMISLASTLMIAIVVWALVYCSSTRFLGELRSLLFEGVGLYMLSVLSTIAAIGLAASFLVDAPMAAIQGIPDLFRLSDVITNIELKGAPADSAAEFVKLSIRYNPDSLAFVQIDSDRRVLLTDAPSLGEAQLRAMTIEAKTPIIWTSKMGAKDSPLPMVGGAELYAQNQEIDNATLKFRLVSAPPVRESITLVLVALFVAVFGLLFMLMQAVSPKAAAIALSAAKSELSQPLPVMLMVIVSLAILLFVFLPFHTFGEDIKLLKDCGVTLILIAAILQAVWSASTSVNDEIEGRTALTLLSKPIHRRSFIIGKIMGVICIVMLMFLVLGTVELLAVAYKPIVESRESSLDPPTWQQCHTEMFQTIPGLALAFFEAIVFGAFAVALGTRFSLLPNFTICFSIYLLGHLTPTIVESAAGGLPLVEFFSQLISAVVPNLSHFSMEAAIDAEVGIPWSVIASVLIYTTIYGMAATLIGLLLFEDRDLA